MARICSTLHVRSKGPAALLRGPGGLALAALALGAALQVNFGQYSPAALQLLSIGLIAALVGAFTLRGEGKRIDADDPDATLLKLLTAGLGFQFALLMTSNPAATLIVHSWRDLLPFRIGIVAACACAAAALRVSPQRRWPAGTLVGIHFLLGLWVLRSAPPPPVDVCTFHRDACASLLAGVNPYTIDFPNLYGDGSKYYDAALVVRGRLRFGYPYPPLNLALLLPGYLAGDFRLALLTAMSAAGALIMLARPSRLATLAGALFLFTPRGFFVLEAGWTEPLIALLLAGVMFAAVRRWRGLPILFGLLLASKQYMVLALPLGLLLFETGDRRWNGPEFQTRLRPWLIALGVAAAVTVPLAARDVAAFVKSVVILQFRQPIRTDSLSYLPWIVTHSGSPAVMLAPFVLAMALIGAAVRKLPRTPAGFSAAMGLVFLVFFATNKQAFCGYYLLVIAAFCCAVGVDSEAAPTASRPNAHMS